MPKPNILTETKLTKDMVATLQQHFDELAQDGVVTLEISEEHGVWIQSPDGRRLFLGATEVFPNEKPFH